MIRPGSVIAALAALALGAAPLAAQAAAPKPAEAAAKAPPGLSKENKEKGKKEAPAIISGSGVACTMNDAAFLGNSEEKVDGKAVKTNVYEVACSEGIGYVLLSKPNAKPQSFNCIQVADSPLSCKLEGNANPAASLQPVIAKTGRSCQVNKAKYIGSSPSTGIDRYEIGCSDGPGLVLDAPSPGSSAKADAMTCLKAESAQVDCTFTPREARRAALAKLTSAEPSAKDCAVKDVRWVTSDPAKNSDYYEVGCDGGKPGFMAEVAVNGSLLRAMPCAQTQLIAGGCTMTDINTAQTTENGAYTKLAKAGGYACDVNKYRSLGVDPSTKSEVVEIACANRPDGAVAYFPIDAGGKAQFFDCVRSIARGMNCRLSKEDTAYPKLTGVLASKGKNTCKVSGARAIGIAADKTEYVETACADGLPGFIIAFQDTSDTVKDLITCGSAAAVVGGCKLPTNVAKK
ncbi:MAG: hypothetical protein ABIO39_03390 [Caulobacteraceae bacterium]